MLRQRCLGIQWHIKDQTKLLDSANDLPETTGVLTPRIVFGESPDDFL